MEQLNNSMAARLADRFRGFLPVIVDVETGGFDAERDALLEIAAVVIGMDQEGNLYPHPAVSTHVEAFPGANIDPRALEITGIDPDNPLRGALDERNALDHIFHAIRLAVRQNLSFLNAAVRRVGHKRNPFHPFSCFDTATLSGLAYGQTVLSKAVLAAGYSFDSREAHSAVYDAERTALLFCRIVNRLRALEVLELERVGSTLP
jgi:ribonuclease T